MEAQQRATRLIDQAVQLAEAGHAEAAVPLFQQAVQLAPGDGAAHDMLAQCAGEAGQHELAYSAACAARELLPGSTAALTTLGRAARNVGRLKEAAAAFEAALAGLPVAGASCSSGPGGGSSSGGGGSRGETEEERDALQLELREVQELCQLEVGHSVGLPGLRIYEAAADNPLGPGGVVWDSGTLLARLLVSCSRGEHAAGAGAAAHICTAGCGHGAGAGAGAAAPVPLPGVPTFALPPEAAPPLGGTTRPSLPSRAAAAAALSASSSGLKGSVTQQQHRGQQAQQLPSFLAGARVLELGSGTGVVGIAAACLGAHVVATDLPAVLPLLQRNIDSNAAMVAAAGGSIAAAALDWEDGQGRRGSGNGNGSGSGDGSSNGSGEQPGGADGPGQVPGSAAAAGALAGYPAPEWILGADLVYSLGPVAPLVRTLAALVTNRGAAVEAVEGTQSANDQPGQSQILGDVKLLLAHKRRHEEVDRALLEGMRAAGVPLRVVAREAESRVTVYANAAAAAALGM